jgi:hypothetical protein
MYCPKCATQNISDAKFCRACGANLSLIPLALSGNLPAADAEDQRNDRLGNDWFIRRRRRGKSKEPPSIEDGVESIFIGFAFVLVSLAVLYWFPGGFIWWFWLLIPAFACFGSGIGKIANFKYAQHLKPPGSAPAPIPAAGHPSELRSPNTSEITPSITEGTTRHLGAPVIKQPKENV